MLKKCKFVILILLNLLLSKYVQADNETITVSGSATIKVILDHYKAEIETRAKLKLNIIGSSSAQGIIDLVNNTADLAVTTTVLQMLAKDLPNIDVASLRTYPLGKSSIVFITNLSNSVKSLTTSQLMDILNGKITNWQELGGDFERIIIVTEYIDTGLRSMVETDILNHKINIPVKTVVNIAQVKNIVANLPNALGIISSTIVDSTINKLKLDLDITQPIIFVAKPQANPLILRFIEALKLINLTELY